jgi:hypothetical protein
MKLLAAVRGFVGAFGRRNLILSTVLVLIALASNAQQDSVVGKWRGVYQGITITIVMQPNGQYTQTTQKGTLMTMQSGPYKLVAPNTIIFSVTDWQPKTMQVYHATGTVGGYYTPENTAKPPGATDTYVFSGPNALVLTDLIQHGSIKMVRTQ